MTRSRSAAAVLVAAFLSACTLLPGGDDSSTPEPRSGPLPAVAWSDDTEADVGGTFRIAVSALPENLNPQHSSNAASEIDRLLQPATGSAVRLTDDGGWEIDQTYARRVEVLDTNPLRVQVVLNPDAAWDEGGQITSADMVSAWQALDGDDGYQVRSPDGWDDIASVEPEPGDEDLSYVVTFDDPTADWPELIYPPLPEEVTSDPDTFNTAYVDRPVPSNGPFRVTRVDRERGQVVLERNPHWWGARPHLEAIDVQAASASVQLEALQGGELDAVVVPPAQQGDEVSDLGDDVDVQLAAGTEWTQLTMNAGRAPLDDLQVRQAVALALDREALARLSTASLGAQPAVVGSFTLVPGQVGYDDQSSRLEHDPEAAERLLDEAGWEAGSDGVRTQDGDRLTLVMPVPEGTSANAARADLVAEQLEAVGIEVEREPVDADAFFTDRVIPLDFDLATFTHTGSAFPVADSRARYYPIDSGQNYTGSADDELGDAWDDAVQAVDDDRRYRLITRIDRRLFRDVPVVPLGVIPQVVAVRDTVVSYGASQFRRPDWTQVGFVASDD